MGYHTSFEGRFNLDAPLTEEQQLRLMGIENGYYAHYIREIVNPSERVQLKAVFYKGFAIQWIENPSEAVQLAAIRHDPMGGKREWNYCLQGVPFCI